MRNIFRLRMTCHLRLAILCLFLAFYSIPAKAQPFAYITNTGNNTVSVIDTATNTVTATIPVGTDPFGVGVSPDGSRVYVANGQPSNSVSVIDTNPSSPSFNTVIVTVAVGRDAEGLAVSPDGTRVYVANSEASSVSVINTASNSVIATVPIGRDPNGVGVSPDGTQVYVIGRDSRVIDATTNTVKATLLVSSGGGVAFHPNATRAYVRGSQAIVVFDTTSNTLLATVAVSLDSTGGVAITPDGTRVYATNCSIDTVSVIDTATNLEIATVPVGSCPDGVSVTPDGSRPTVGWFFWTDVPAPPPAEKPPTEIGPWAMP